MLLLAQLAIAQRVPAALSGQWVGECARCADDAMPGDFAKHLDIEIGSSSITIRRGAYSPEVYGLDGPDVRLRDGATARATVEQDRLVAGSAALPSFEVASVKPNRSGERAQSSRIGKGSLTLTNMRLRAMIVTAYGIRPDRIVGAPSWMEDERFDVAARASSDTSDNDLRLMLRALLAERFRLVLRTEMREQPVYALVVARANGTLGPGLEPSTECDADWLSSRAGAAALAASVGAAASGKRPCSVVNGSDGSAAYIIGGARPIEALVGALQGVTDRPVVDRTGLAGTYDFRLRFSAASTGPLATQATDLPELSSVFSAVQEQLGLRLQPARAPVEFLVVERIERPTPD